MTTERRAINALLGRYAAFDLLAVDWQLPTETSPGGPWLRVSLGQRSDDDAQAWAHWEFAIFKATGDVYYVQPDGTVPDDPLMRTCGMEHEQRCCYLHGTHATPHVGCPLR